MKDSSLKHWPELLKDSSSGAELSFKSSGDLHVCLSALSEALFGVQGCAKLPVKM